MPVIFVKGVQPVVLSLAFLFILSSSENCYAEVLDVEIYVIVPSPL